MHVQGNDRMKDTTRYFVMPPEEISFVGFIIHAHEGVAVVRTLDSKRGLVEMLVSPFMVEELEGILEDLRKEVDIQEVSEEQVRQWGVIPGGGEPWR
jgi:hypothetical protein